MDTLQFSYDSVSSRRIVSIAYKVRDGLPGTYEFIDDNFRFLANDLFLGSSTTWSAVISSQSI
jgi:hypothetical protein